MLTYYHNRKLKETDITKIISNINNKFKKLI